MGFLGFAARLTIGVGFGSGFRVEGLGFGIVARFQPGRCVPRLSILQVSCGPSGDVSFTGRW